MRRILATIAAAMMVMACVDTARADNLLENPGFESGTIAPWEHYRFTEGPEEPPQEERWSTADWGAHSGEHCAFGIGSNYVFRQVVIDQDLRWSDITDLSFWLRQDLPEEGSMTFVLDVQFDNPNDDAPGLGTMDFYFPETDEWTYYDGLSLLQRAGRFAERVLGDEVRLLSVGVVGTFSTATFTDDWTLVPEPASVTLMGLSGLILLRRRRG